MSQPKLTLRPPPNVDFVQGYPGIPPGGHDRPQAAVKGAIEVRVGPQGVKAKWVRIELRKIETLPGGGVANTFFDFVGQSPINLWQSPNDEYSTLHANDFPFFIRVPESIPPTISLEKGAGIKYELIASICVQGKKGFLRRDKPTITATASTITIDKHELHSTWPIYSQPETRSHSQDGVTLVVDRSHTCYGPGDRVVIMATVKSDTVHTVMLRGFEFMLRETTVFRAGPHTQGKKGSPQVKVASVGEQKVPVNATLYGGTQHKAELSVTIPSNHTSATINAARHIDITYVLTVKALMSTGQPIVMDLPVIISNWPRAVSNEAMRRIGQAFNVSLPGQPISTASQSASAHSESQRFAPALMGNAAAISSGKTSSGRTTSSHGYSNSMEKKGSTTDLRSSKNPLGQFATSPIASDRQMGDRFGIADEFGTRKKGSDNGHTSFAAQTIGALNTAANNASTGTGIGRGSSAASSESNSVPTRPRSSSGRASAAARLTIANVTEEEIREHMEAEAELARRKPPTIVESPVATVPPSNPVSSPAPTTKVMSPTPMHKSQPLANKWATAEEEKRRLYEHAVANVERVQGQVMSPSEVTPSWQAEAGGSSGSGALPSTPPPSKSTKRWLSAEEEKARLYEEAQAAVIRARGYDASEAPASSAYSSSSSAADLRSPSMSPGAALFSEAMSAINRPLVPSGSPTPSGHAGNGTPGPATHSSHPAAISSPIVSPIPERQWAVPSGLSAADEKAMLQRYYEAKNAVYQTQTAHYGRVPGNAGPVSYDALYPASQQAAPPTPSQSYPQSQTLSPPPSQTPPVEMPPAFPAASGSSSQHPILSEKERLRRHFEAQDVAAAANLQQPQSPPYSQLQWQAPPPQDPYPVPHSYPQSPPAAPMSADAAGRYSSYGPPPPATPPPFSAPAGQPLSAYAEKEMLRRRYEAQDAASRNSTVPSPPPRGSQFMSGPRGRPPPTPPTSPNAPGSGRPLTAAEEKARLRAMYDAEERAQRSPPPVHVPPPGVQVPYSSPPPSNGYHSVETTERGSSTPSPAPTAVPRTPPPPPPLAPKPPREYIEETRQEDLRTVAKLQAIDRVGLQGALEPSEVAVERKSTPRFSSASPPIPATTFSPPPPRSPRLAAEPQPIRAVESDDDVNDDDGEEEDDGREVDVDPAENTFGPGALSEALNNVAAAAAASSRPPSAGGASGPALNGFALPVPPPPPLPAQAAVGSSD
ncbi:hypothetical protein BD413DRAFT_607828 [Trametes elegans]|nr:hypothetical protein BD413DRAFT_607828 [Trametes elegans]